MLVRAAWIALATTLAAGNLAAAGPDRLSILLGSEHLGSNGQFNGQNPGLFLSWDGDNETSLTIGAYKNSYSRTSWSITGHWRPLDLGQAQAGIFAGVAHYPGDGRRFAAHLGGDWVPIGGLEILAGNLFFQFIPGDGKHVAGILATGITLPF